MLDLPAGTELGGDRQIRGQRARCDRIDEAGAAQRVEVRERHVDLGMGLVDPCRVQPAGGRLVAPSEPEGSSGQAAEESGLGVRLEIDDCVPAAGTQFSQQRQQPCQRARAEALQRLPIDCEDLVDRPAGLQQ